MSYSAAAAKQIDLIFQAQGLPGLRSAVVSISSEIARLDADMSSKAVAFQNQNISLEDYNNEIRKTMHSYLQYNEALKAANEAIRIGNVYTADAISKKSALGRAVLELSRGLEDFSTGGFIGVLNNIPTLIWNIASALGYAKSIVTKITAAVSILATITYVVWRNWDGIVRQFHGFTEGWTAQKPIESVEGLNSSLRDLRKELDTIQERKWVTPEEIARAKEINQEIEKQSERLKQLKAVQKWDEAAKVEFTKQQEALGKKWTNALDDLAIRGEVEKGLIRSLIDNKHMNPKEAQDEAKKLLADLFENGKIADGNLRSLFEQYMNGSKRGREALKKLNDAMDFGKVSDDIKNDIQDLQERFSKAPDAKEAQKLALEISNRYQDMMSHFNDNPLLVTEEMRNQLWRELQKSAEDNHRKVIEMETTDAQKREKILRQAKEKADAKVEKISDNYMKWVKSTFTKTAKNLVMDGKGVDEILEIVKKDNRFNNLSDASKSKVISTISKWFVDDIKATHDALIEQIMIDTRRTKSEATRKLARERIDAAFKDQKDLVQQLMIEAVVSMAKATGTKINPDEAMTLAEEMGKRFEALQINTKAQGGIAQILANPALAGRFMQYVEGMTPQVGQHDAYIMAMQQFGAFAAKNSGIQVGNDRERWASAISSVTEKDAQSLSLHGLQRDAANSLFQHSRLVTNYILKNQREMELLNQGIERLNRMLFNGTQERVNQFRGGPR